MPGGKICSIAICRSNSKTAKENGKNIMFFSFPKDPEICKEWVKRCFRKDQFSPRYKRVCSKHFKLQDFEDILKSRLMGTQPKKLKKTAIPSLLIDPSKLADEESLAYLTNEEEEILLETEMDMPCQQLIKLVIPSLLIDPSKLKQEFAYSQNADNIILETDIDEPSVVPSLLIDYSELIIREISPSNMTDEEENIVLETARNNDCDKKQQIYLAQEVRQRLEALEKENELLRKENKGLKLKVVDLQQQLLNKQQNYS